MGKHCTAEDRENRIINETRAQFSTLTRAILAGEPVATKRISDALGDFLADDNAMADVVRGALTHSDALLPVLTGLIWDEAGELAEFEVDQMEISRAESRDENRIAMAECDRAMALSN